jgi:hypothetical protein
MLTLQEQLDRLIQRKGEQDSLVQMLRNQIVAQSSGKTFQELYLTGSVNKESTPIGDCLKKESPSRLNEVSQIPAESQQDQGKLILNSNSLGVQITEEFEKDFAIILKGLTSKRKGKKYAEALTKLNSMIDESWLSDAGDRIGDGIPLNYLQSLLSDQHLSEMEGLEDEQIDKISNKQRLKFARNILFSIEESLDADICPGYWVLEVHGFKASFFLGYSVTGYSFSGIEWEDYGAFQTKSDFEDHIRIVDGMAINNKLSLSGKTLGFFDLSDSQILTSLWLT